MRSLSSIFIVVFLLCLLKAQAQVLDFTIPATACSAESLVITNLSSGVSSPSWDFCESDLKVSPVFADKGVVNQAGGLTDIRVYKDGSNWFGFVCAGDGDKLTRLSFGSSLSNIPVQSKAFDFYKPSGVEIVQLNGNWFGLVGTFIDPRLYLLNFGSSLSNTPSVSEVNLPVNSIMAARSIRLVQEGSNLIAFVANWYQSKVTRINFGTSLTTTVSSVDLIEMGSTNLLGLDVIEDANGKYALTTDYGASKIYKVSFGNSWLAASPVVEEVTAGSLANPAIIELEYEGGHYYAMLVLNSGNVYRMDFGANMSGLTPTVNDLGSFGDMVSIVRGMSIVRNNGSYMAVLTSYTTNKVYTLEFTDTGCSASVSTYEGPDPPTLSYSTAGTYPVTLRVEGAGLETDHITKQVVVSASVAPDVSLSIINKQCQSQSNEFSVTSLSSIASYQWLFGDGNTSVAVSPTHLYTTAGTYQVEVQVTSSNGCTNSAVSEVNIFSAPDFNLPTASPICTNQEYLFSNTTQFGSTAEPTWEWYVNNLLTDNTRDFLLTLQNSNAVNIKLKASNSECSNEIIKSITTVEVGSPIDFDVTGKNCQGSLISFTGSSPDPISNYVWDFGDGNHSTSQSATNSFATNGNFDVELKATNVGGCENSKTKTITIYTTPQTNFSLDLPPFSCAGSPSQFNDQTPAPTDSSINSWIWSFGDGNNSFVQNPLHLYSNSGDYTVSLFITTDMGCSDSEIQSVTIDLPANDCLLNALFDAPENVCKEERISFVNFSTGSTESEWDFCEQDLQELPVFRDMGMVSQSGGLVDLRIQQDNGQWYGFVCDGDAKKLTRLSFGNSLQNVPQVSNVGDFQAPPTGVEVVQLGGTWYGLLGTYGTPSHLYLLEFGSGLSNAPVVKEITLPDPQAIVSSRSIRLVQEGSELIGFVANEGQQKITRINFGSQLTDQVSTVDLIEMGDFSLGLDAGEDGARKYLVVTSYSSGKLYKVDFGSSWKSAAPVVETVSIGLPFANPAMVDIEFEGGNYYLLSVLNSGNVYRMNFGSDLSGLSPTVENLGSFSGMFNVRGMDLRRNGDSYTALFTSYTTNKIYGLDFKSATCSASLSSFIGDDPPVVSYSTGGTYEVTLRVKGISLLTDKMSKQVVVSPSLAPDVSLSLTNRQCLGQANEYLITSLATLTNYAWSFGDNTTSQSAAPTHSYATAGLYQISVEVVSVNGCSNSSTGEIKIFSPPDFNLPTANPICTNQEYLFSNTTQFGSTAEPAWEWYVNNLLTDDTRDFLLTLQNSNSVSIKLKASNSECSNEIIKSITTVEVGSVIDFDVTGKNCQGNLITFAGSSPDPISSYVWDFGDGSLRTGQNATNTFATNGDFDVELKATNLGGCENSKTKTITIYTTPQPNFSLDLPPFSCAGSPSQFNDQTPTPTDSNINSWIWNFGDIANGTSAVKNPVYTYPLAGPYNVSLTTTTNFGCTASISRTIQIADPPKAAFTISPSCLNQATNFTDTSSGTNKSWLWKIGSSSYTLQNPAHVFSNTGNHTAQLTVTGNNNCVAVTSKTINVPIPPILDFSTANNCAGQPTLFEDITSPGADLAVLRNWDFGGKGNGTGASTQFSFPAAGTYNVKLTVTNQSGCTYTLAMNTSIVTAPVAEFTTSVESGPAPLSVQFTNSSLSSTDFQWQFNDPANSTSKELSPLFTYTSLGDFVVDLTARNAQGCVSTKSKIIHVIIPYTEIELTDFELLHDAATGSIRPVLTIKNNSNYTVNNVDVVLDIAGNASVKEKLTTSILPNGSSSQILNYELLPGGSKLTYVCAEIHLNEDVNLGNNSDCISLQSGEIVFSPYPNPVRDQLNVDWIAISEGTVKVSVITQTGQLAFQKEVAGVGVGLNQIILDISKLNSGFYILVFESSEIKKTFPLVIQN